MATAMVATEKKRMDVYKAMTVETRAVADSIQEKITRLETGSILAYYNMGKLLGPVKSEESTYGEKAIIQLAEHSNIAGGANTLYNLISFAESFDKEFVMQHTDVPLANGRRLTIHHWTQLVKIKEIGKVNKMLKRIVVESMSSNDLEVEIRAGAGGEVKHVRQGGRTPNIPSNPVIGLQRTIDLANKFNRWESHVCEAIFSSIDTMAPDSVTDILIAKVQSTLDMVQQAKKTATDMEGKLEANLTRLTAVMAKRGGAAAADGEAPEAKTPAAKTVSKPAAGRKAADTKKDKKAGKAAKQKKAVAV